MIGPRLQLELLGELARNYVTPRAAEILREVLGDAADSLIEIAHGRTTRNADLRRACRTRYMELRDAGECRATAEATCIREFQNVLPAQTVTHVCRKGLRDQEKVAPQVGAERKPSPP